VSREYGRSRRLAVRLGKFKQTLAKLPYHQMVHGLFSRSNNNSGRWARMARTRRHCSGFHAVRSSQGMLDSRIGLIWPGHPTVAG